MNTLLSRYIGHAIKDNILRYGTNVELVFEDCRYISGDKFTGDGLQEDCNVSVVKTKAVVYPYFSWSDKSIEFSNIADVVKNLDQTYILQIPYNDYDINKLKRVVISGIGDTVVRGIRFHAVGLEVIDFVVLVEREG